MVLQDRHNFYYLKQGETATHYMTMDCTGGVSELHKSQLFEVTPTDKVSMSHDEYRRYLRFCRAFERLV